MAVHACKILVIGPPATGKSLLCKIVANQLLFPNARYDPTEASIVRVQRYQSAASSGQTSTVHLWDCSGSPSALEHCQALTEGADGVVLVYNPNKASHEPELERMYKEFVQPLGLMKQQCMVLGINWTTGHSIHGSLSGRLGQLQQRQKQQAEDDVIEATQL